MSEAQAVAEAPVQDAQPLLKVVRGNPSPAELAALVTVIAALGNGTGAAAPEPTANGPWSRLPSWPPAPGPASWRWSAGR